MEKVACVFDTEIIDLELGINNKIAELKKQGCSILNVTLGGRSSSYRRNWGALILYDDHG